MYELNVKLAAMPMGCGAEFLGDIMITRDTITSKQRSKLKGIASTIAPIAQIGKGGVTENMVKSLHDVLEARELIKINVLQNADDTPWDLVENLADLLDAVPVAVIGRKAILYRRSSRENFAHIEV